MMMMIDEGADEDEDADEVNCNAADHGSDEVDY